MVSRCAVHARHAVVLGTDRIPMGPTVREVGGERVLVPVLHPLWLLLISALRISMLLLLLLRVLHVLSPCLVAAWLILYHFVGSCYIAAAPATSPLLETSVVGLLKCSMLLVLCPLLGIGLLCLPLLCWGRLGCLPLLQGGRWGSTHVPVLVL